MNMDYNEIKNKLESPIENLLFESIFMSFADGVSFRSQVQFGTICGIFRADFVIEGFGRRIALECDGKEFHNYRRDEWRNEMILGTGEVDWIYHFSGKDINFRTEECAYILATQESWAFNEEAIASLRAKCSLNSPDLAIELDETDCSHMGTLLFELEEESERLDYPVVIRVERRSKNWELRRYEFAKAAGGGNLDALMSQRDDL
jgi:hypothetical protein